MMNIPPTRFTCLTVGTRGDVQPYIALCKGLNAKGHSCTIATHVEYKDWIEDHGIKFQPVAGDPALMSQMVMSQNFAVSLAMEGEQVEKIKGWVAEIVESAWSACQGAEAIIENSSAIAGFHIAQAMKIPYYRTYMMPSTPTTAFSHPLMPEEPPQQDVGMQNYMSHVKFLMLYWKAFGVVVNNWRVQTLRLPVITIEEMASFKTPTIYNFSPSVVPPPMDWDDNVLVAGNWWLDCSNSSSKSKWTPPVDLTQFISTARSLEKKLVFIGFSSVIVSNSKEFFDVIVNAVEKVGVHAIIGLGWSNRDSGSGDPVISNKKFIHVVDNVPHDWLFPQMDAVVHHGGAGTTGASLRAGIPTVVYPFGADQFFYAGRVETLGVGYWLREFSTPGLADALSNIFKYQGIPQRAKALGEQIRKENGVERAIEFIYEKMDEVKRSVNPV